MAKTQFLYYKNLNHHKKYTIVSDWHHHIYLENPALHHHIYLENPALHHHIYLENPALHHHIYLENPALHHHIYLENPALPRLLKVTWMFLPGNKIFAIKVDLLNLESQNQAETFPWVSQIPQSKYEANQSRGFWVMIDKQT